MKKYVMAVLSCIIAVFVLLGTMSTAFAALNPNYATNTTKSTFKRVGYIQCQPSYVQNGKHAVFGRFKYYQTNSAGTSIIKQSPEIQTAKGTGPNDKSILKAEYTFTGNSVTSSLIAFNYGWSMYPDDGGWPFSNPEEPVTD